MGKLILAIIVVACLQVVFVVYTAVDKPAEMIAYVPDPNPAGTILDLASIDNPYPINEPAPPAVASITSHPEPRRAKTVASAMDNRRQTIARPHSITVTRARKPRHAAPVRPAERYAMKARRPEPNYRKGFTNTIILYNRSNALSGDRVANVPRVKKRSFMAKALPILKKPWDLIKGIASRLD